MAGMPPLKARYAHTNLVARDWKRLARFYEEVFGCVPVPPERNARGAWADRVTGLKDVHVRGMHLRLPGGGDGGPTLEIFEYAAPADGPAPAVNRPGFAHLAFEVEDVDAARETVRAAGGRDYAERVSVDIPGAGTITLIYVADPEGNILELQKWS